MVDPKLHSLMKVVETGSFTRAAEQLSLTQPAVSQHIRSLESELKHYEDMSRYLSFEENLEKYVSRDEIDKLNSLRGRKQTNYRKKLNSKIQVKSRFDTQRREKKRKQLFSQMQLVDQGPVCDGCPTETRHAFKPSAKRDTVVRKFVGNEEQFTIYNSTHCVTLRRP